MSSITTPIFLALIALEKLDGLDMEGQFGLQFQNMTPHFVAEAQKGKKYG
jgi:hypothetical protein